MFRGGSKSPGSSPVIPLQRLREGVADRAVEELDAAELRGLELSQVGLAIL